MKKKKLLTTAIDSDKFNKILRILSENKIPFTYRQNVFSEGIFATNFKWDFYVPDDYYDYASHLLHGI